MLPVGWLVLAVVLAVLLTVWVTFTLTRLDRLHARVDAAQAALDAQLVRRAAALAHVAESAESRIADRHRVEVDAVAQRALDAGVAQHTPDEGPTESLGVDVAGGAREAVENAVGRAVAELSEHPDLLGPMASAELREAAARVLIARRFYNDAVRDTRLLRARRMPRLLHLAGRRRLPEFFDIDDTLPTAPANAPGDATLEAVPPNTTPSAASDEEEPR